MVMTDLRWGIVATGGIARMFAADLRLAGMTVSAVGSRTDDTATAFAREFDIPHAYGSYAEVIASPDVDIVYVATPHPQHVEVALAAIGAGKHVLIEKPITLEAVEAERIAEAAAASGVLAMEAMWTRYLPHMARIREIVADGTLGEIRYLSADHTQRLPSDPGHRLNALELGGGALLDLGIYPISFAWDILGAPSTVHAAGRLGETGADTEVATMFTYPSGAIATTLSSARAAGSNTATVVGTEARIEIDAVWYAPTSFRVIATDGTVLETFDGSVSGRGMQYQAQYAQELIDRGQYDSDLLPIDESVSIMATLDEVRAQVGVHYPQLS